MSMERGWKSSAKRSKRLETQVAKKLGGKRQPASGSMWFATEDIRWQDLRIEQKFTDADYYSLTEETFLTVYNRAKQRGQIGTVLVIFPKTRTYLFVFTEGDAKSLLLPVSGEAIPANTKKSVRITPTSPSPQQLNNLRLYTYPLDKVKDVIDAQGTDA